MGRDNQPSDRQRAKLGRKQGRRMPGRRFLVVCEGEKTEFNYLEEIRMSLRLPAANIQILHGGVTEPKQIVDAAWDIFQKGNGRFRPKAADVVVAVFDRDEHRTYHDALDYATSLDARKSKNDDKQPVRFLAVPTNSCFELWLLLHFKDQQTPIHRHVALDQVREHLPDYDKGMKGLFAQTREHLPTALRRAYRLAERIDPRMDGPWTGMHLLVHLLLDEDLELPKFPAPVRGDPERISEVAKRLGTSTQV